MPYRRINGAKIHFTDTGGNGEIVLFAHGLGWSGRMFSGQVEALRKTHRCITIDFRGQGFSEATARGYKIDELTSDILEFIRTLELNSLHFVGLSMGGFIGMRLAARYPQLLKSLTLLNTSADSERLSKKVKYQLLSFAIQIFGMPSISSAAMKVMFGKTFQQDESRCHERDQWRKELISNHKHGIVSAIKGVIHRPAILPELNKITSPTLVIVGEEDTATPPSCGEQIVNSIAGATLRRIRNCGHSSSIEQPKLVNACLLQFLGSSSTHTSC